ncbi:MAG: MBL fold metallo-hydrolase [Paludibacteraceae bacterium]|nr:MBL fold metallo-hydrolase [Paludibacteraceae bacterium]
MNKIKFLGTGTSVGVPEIGCQCEVCTSTDPRDKRLRCSALITYKGKRILIDCGPDFRIQMLTVDFAPIDAVLLTHEHYDHSFGIDDLRPFTRVAPVEIYAEHRLNEIQRIRLPYCFGQRYPGSPKLSLNDIEADKPFTIADGIEIMPIRVFHGRIPIVGFRIGNTAYITDASHIDDNELTKLQGIDLLVLNALRIEPHPSHFSLSEAIDMAKRINAPHTYFIHMAHTIGKHADVQRSLPQDMALAYDGLEIEF